MARVYQTPKRGSREAGVRRTARRFRLSYEQGGYAGSVVTNREEHNTLTTPSALCRRAERTCIDKLYKSCTSRNRSKVLFPLSA